MSLTSKTIFPGRLLAKLFIALLLGSCSNETTEEVIHATETVSGDTLISFHGIWASEKYINVLLETRSPRKAQGDDFFISIPVSLNQSGHTYVYHEGGSMFHVVKNSTTYFIKYGGYVDDSLEIGFLSTDKMRIDSEVYLKMKDGARISEDLLFRGTYTCNDTEVVFSEYGTISGLSTIDSYIVQNDYYGPGYGAVDIVYLGRNAGEHVFNFIGDTLFIYKMMCMEEGENGECNDIQAGELVYKLVKIK